MVATTYGGFSMCQSLCQSDTLPAASHLILMTTPWSTYYYCHPTDEKLKVREKEVAPLVNVSTETAILEYQTSGPGPLIIPQSAF